MRPWLPVVALLAALAPGGAGSAPAEPVVPGFVVEPYATVPGPVSLSFDRTGALFVGRDAAGRIRRIPPDGGAAADYGTSDIPDPDGVLVDDGSASGTPGAVIVCGDATGTGDGGGQIVAVLPQTLPDAGTVTLHAPSGVLSNPNYLERVGDRLLISDAAERAIFAFVPPGPPEVLIQSPATPSFLAVDASDRIYVSHSDGVIRQYGADGSPLNEAFLSGLGVPAPIAAGPGGPAFGTDLYVLDGASGRLLRVSPDGEAVEIGDGFPVAVGELEFGPDGALYVASLAEGEVLRIAPPPPLEPFLCYGAKASGDAAFEGIDVTLRDAFETRDAEVVKPKAVCNPASVDGAEIEDARTHLASYQIKGEGKHAKQTERVENALDGELVLDTLAKGADRVLLPSALRLNAKPDPLGDTGVDPFKCYRARRADRERVGCRELSVADVFGPAERRLCVKGPKHLCLPVEVVGAPDSEVQRPDDRLVCYAVKPAKKEESVSRTGIHVGNELGDDQLLETVSRTLRGRTSVVRGTVRGDTNETVEGTGTTRPGTWSDLEDGPRWAGGGALVSDGLWLSSKFTKADTYPEGEVRQWRVFVEIDLTQNETGGSPGVAMISRGIPGIPEEESLLEARGPGTAQGVRAESPFFTPPEGTTLADLAEASQEFEAHGGSSTEAFAFALEDWGVEYELVSSSTGGKGSVAEEELCVPSRALDD